MTSTSRRSIAALLCAPLLATGLAACGTTGTSTSGFHGEQQQVAKAVARLQSHASALEAKKICGEDLAAARVAQLERSGGCKKALESQLKQVDNFDVTVESVTIARAGKTATARVKGTYAGKQAIQTMTFVREHGVWRASGVS
jgi:hypothetical protein